MDKAFMGLAYIRSCWIIDELFVGGDYTFREKGKKQLNNLINSSKAMILVSHDQTLLRGLCNRFIWMENGSVIRSGDSKILDEYLNKY